MWELFCTSASPFTGGFYLPREHLLSLQKIHFQGLSLLLLWLSTQAASLLYFSQMILFLSMTPPHCFWPKCGILVVILLLWFTLAHCKSQINFPIYIKNIFQIYFSVDSGLHQTERKKTKNNTLCKHRESFCKNFAEGLQTWIFNAKTFREILDQISVGMSGRFSSKVQSWQHYCLQILH